MFLRYTFINQTENDDEQLWQMIMVFRFHTRVPPERSCVNSKEYPGLPKWFCSRKNNTKVLWIFSGKVSLNPYSVTTFPPPRQCKACCDWRCSSKPASPLSTSGSRCCRWHLRNWLPSSLPALPSFLVCLLLFCLPPACLSTFLPSCLHFFLLLLLLDKHTIIIVERLCEPSQRSTDDTPTVFGLSNCFLWKYYSFVFIFYNFKIFISVLSLLFE